MAKKILLGVSGGIAAYKSAELLREMIKKNWSVQVVMTQAATEFLAPMTMQALSGKPVFTEQFDPRIPNMMPHIELSKTSDAIVIAPATANGIAKMAQGLSNNLLLSLCLARSCPLIIAPAMNDRMWHHPATQRNIEQLKADGVIVLGPESGDLACGVTGDGRMLDVHALSDLIEAHLSEKTLLGKQVLITAGPTVEPIDPVRAITNQSSGKMGYAIAKAAAAAGAQVTLISGPTHLSAPVGVDRVNVTTAEQMYQAVMSHIDRQHIFISVAAVADYRVENPADIKIKKEKAENLTLNLTPNPDILAAVASLPNPPFCVGFSAETDNLIKNASIKREKKKIPMMVVNDANLAIGSDMNQITVLEDHHITELPLARKQELAYKLVSLIAQRVSPTNQ